MPCRVADRSASDPGGHYSLFPVANKVNFREDANDRWSVQSRARGGPATRTARVRLSSLRRAPRLLFGFRAEGVGR
jgi:hypothetical protein